MRSHFQNFYFTELGCDKNSACKFSGRSNGRIFLNHQPVNSIDIYHFSLFIDPNENMLIIYQNDRINEHITAQILDWPETAACAATVGGRR